MSAVLVETDGSNVFVRKDGRTVAEGPLESACAGAINAAVDACDSEHGTVSIAAGRYPLSSPVVVDKQIALTGEGYATRLVPPAGDYAIKVMATERSRPRRDIIREADPWLHDMEVRTFGIHVERLAIDGEGSGRGIYAEFLIECSFRDLWIHRTGGSGIALGPSVMETTFETIHLLDCGNADEAAIAISAQPEGDASNNVIFDKVFTIFPNSAGLEIGGGSGGQKPRLITLRDCLFHGWLPVEKAARAPLLRVRRLDDQRGLRIIGGRFTNTAPDFPLIDLSSGEMRVSSASFGGGGASCALYTKHGTTAFVTDSTFHGSRGKEGNPGDIAHVNGALVFRGNGAVGNHGRIVMGDQATALVDGNVFDHSQIRRPIVLVPGDRSNLRFRNNIVRNGGGEIVPGMDDAILRAENIIQ